MNLTAKDLLSLIPLATGHQPTEAAALVMLKGNRVLGVAETSIEGLALAPEQLIEEMQVVSPDALVLVYHTEIIPEEILLILTTLLDLVFEGREIKLHDAFIVTPERWKTLGHDCGNDSCEGPTSDLNGAALAAEYIARGAELEFREHH